MNDAMEKALQEFQSHSDNWHGEPSKDGFVGGWNACLAECVRMLREQGDALCNDVANELQQKLGAKP